MASKQQQQPQTSIWLNNPLTNLFRRSGRKPKKEAKRENEENYVGIVSGDKKTKRSASCDTLHQSRLSTRFVDNQKQQRKTPELFINGNSKKEKSSEMNSTKINRGGLNSSFSSLLHQRIFLSSRGARQIL